MSGYLLKQESQSMQAKELKKSLLPIEENKAFKEKLELLKDREFESLQDYIIALDKL